MAMIQLRRFNYLRNDETDLVGGFDPFEKY